MANPDHIEADTTTNSGRLGQLALSPDKGTRRRVAANPNTTARDVDALGQDLKAEVREWVPKHARCTPARRALLATDPAWNVRWKAAESNLPTHVLEVLINDEHETVRWAAHRNSNLSKNTIDTQVEVLEAKGDIHGLCQIALNTNTRAKTVAQLALHPDVTVRTTAEVTQQSMGTANR